MSSTGRLSIEVVGGQAAPAQLPTSGRLSIGSSDKAGYRVAGQGVADVHCTIGRIKGGGWALKDLGSEFGTFVNGKRVDSVRLQEDDAILIGSSRLRVFDPAREAASASATATASQQAPEPAPDRPVVSAPKRGVSARAANPEAPARGADSALEIDGYRIEKRIGSGGMGHVYLAEQTRLARKVALKVLSPKLEADASFVRDFQAEARSAAALNHPNVVTVFDVGECAGHHYLSMEYMERGCLESRLSELGPIPWREVLEILRSAAAGLVYAEARGIVHRDIKPANLMQNADRVTKIADLGLAVQADNESLREEGRKLLGTPHFIAPELIRGGVADCRSDLYSLGATAYRLLSGHTPFEGATAKEILRGALRDEPRPLKELVPDLPAPFAALVERLLEKDPEARHPSAQILLAELDQLLEGGGKPAVVAASGGSRWLPALIGLIAIIGVGALVSKLLGGNATPDGEPHTGPRENQGVAAKELPASIPEVDESGLEATSESTDPIVDLRVSEADATIRYYALAEQQLSETERIAGLRALAAEFEGTDMSRRARGEAQELERQVAERQQAAQARESMRGNALGALRAAARLDSPEAPPASQALKDMLAVPVAAEVYLDDTFRSERAALFEQVVARAESAAAAARKAADGQAARGDFDALRKTLEDFLKTADWPSFPNEEPAGLASLRRATSDLRERLQGLERERTAFASTRVKLDQELMGRSLSGPEGLEAELRRLDFGAAAVRLEALAGQLIGAEPKARISAMAKEMAEARDAFRTLGRAWGQGYWQRTLVADPRDNRSHSAEAVGADEKGVLLEDPKGPIHVPWSAWAREPRAISQLFKSRLDRAWTPEEERGIATCLRVASTLVAISPALESWRSGPTRLDERDLRKVSGAFEEAEEWARTSPASLRQVQAEKQASELLVRALIAEASSSPARAVDALERLLGDHADSLVVSLLSDGTEWRLGRSSSASPTQPQAEASSVPPDAAPSAEPREDQDEEAAKADGQPGGER